MAAVDPHQPTSHGPTAEPSAPAFPTLPVAVFRPSPAERVLVAGPRHARALCLSAGAPPNGVAAVFVDPCGALVAIATAPAAVVTAMLADPAPFAKMAELLAASRVYLEVPAAQSRAVGAAVGAVLRPLCIATELLARLEPA
ncbi:hypothetical protein [Candidatus Poriferisodalis sp.]|uniref:hypothetical protein n=1 Tax=Candidatus Poriferisodalis sp. TaxID=3101277 RepID=UPI003B02157F